MRGEAIIQSEAGSFQPAARSANSARPDMPSNVTPTAPAEPGAPAAVTFVLPAIGAGGSEHVVTMLCNHLAGQGRTIRLICFAPPGTRPFYPLDARVAVDCLGPPNPPKGRIAGALETLRRYRLLKAAFSKARPDLVISFLTRTNVVAALAADRLAIPVIVSERNNPQRQSVGPVWARLRAASYRRAAALVTMTRGAAAHFSAVRGRIDRVIPNHAAWTGPDSPRSAAGRQLAAVGRLVEQKGFDLLLEAFARIAERFPDWHLTIWGDGPLRPALVGQCRALGLDKRVTMPGVTDRPGAWIESADLFVLSSRFEGWGLVVGEAMAGGLPVVSFDCPWGPGEMIENGVSGLLVHDGDVAALAAALARAMGDADLRERLGAAGRTAMHQFAPERILARWDDLIAEVVSNSGKTTRESVR